MKKNGRINCLEANIKIKTGPKGNWAGGGGGEGVGEINF